jgi:hypothetical protein
VGTKQSVGPTSPLLGRQNTIRVDVTLPLGAECFPGRTCRLLRVVLGVHGEGRRSRSCRALRRRETHLPIAVLSTVAM